MLARIDHTAALRPAALARAHDVPPAVLEDALAQLIERGLAEEICAGDDADALTSAGRAVLGRLVAARRARLSAYLGGWSPERQDELAALRHRMARDLAAPTPA